MWFNADKSQLIPFQEKGEKRFNGLHLHFIYFTLFTVFFTVKPGSRTLRESQTPFAAKLPNVAPRLWIYKLLIWCSGKCSHHFITSSKIEVEEK